MNNMNKTAKGTMRLGIIGMGQRACFHGGLLFENCKDMNITIAGLCDNRKDRLRYAKKVYSEEFGYDISVYEDYNRMYADARLDGVFIAGPNYLHCDMAVSAFKAGINVLCEKPMEVSLSKCDEIIRAAKQADKVLAMGMQMHYRRRYFKIREIIKSGAIGKPAMVWCKEYRGPYAEMKDWVWESSKSGGAIVEKNCHHYDILDMWVESDPTVVYASGNIMKHEAPYGYKSQIIDNAWIVSDYENGARAMVGICFLAEGEHRREFGVYGTEGSIIIESADNELIRVKYNDGRNELYDYSAPGADVVRGGLFRDFVNCIRGGGEPLVTGEMAKKSLLVPMAAELSIAEKRMVNVSEIN